MSNDQEPSKILKSPFKDSLGAKVVMLAITSLLLWIPLSMVDHLAEERRQSAKQAHSDIANAWGPADATITQPVLLIPYDESWVSQESYEEKGEKKVKTVRHKAENWFYLFPAKSTVTSKISAEPKRRSIYSVNTFIAKNKISGEFNLEDIKVSPTREDSQISIHWVNAEFIIPFKDDQKSLTGISLTTDGAPRRIQSKSTSWKSPNNYLTARLSDYSPLTKNQAFTFVLSYELRGVDSLNFATNASQVTIDLETNWENTSFKNLLPIKTAHGALGKKATWDSSSFGLSDDTDGTADSVSSLVTTVEKISYQNVATIDLLSAENHYTQLDRVTKYWFLFLLLTFATFFVLELRNATPVHFLQYGLIGIANVMFFLITLSFSEHLGFNVAYLIASLAVMGLIAMYAKGVFQKRSAGWSVGGLLGVQYLTAHRLLSEDEYALVLGTTLLFMGLAIVMWFTRKLGNLDGAAAAKIAQ